MKVIIINGPNLNLLKDRNREMYGDVSFEEYYSNLVKKFSDLNLAYYQSNVEGELINKLQESAHVYDYIIFNAGGYTHTSVAIADCVEAINIPVLEVHISNIYSREKFRHKSLLSRYCLGSIIGLGLDGYKLALEHINTR